MPFVSLLTPYTQDDESKLFVRIREGNWRLYIRQLQSEFFGVLFFTFFVTGSVVSATALVSDPVIRWIMIALIQGFAIAASIWLVSGISGCQLNPAVTVAIIITGRLGLLNGAGLIIFQAVGAICGAALMKAATPGTYEKLLGATDLNPNISFARGFFLELVATCFLVFVVLGVSVYTEWDPKLKRIAPFAIGIAVVAGVMTLVPFTGGSLNPARSFGPAVMQNHWHYHYLYWFGPIAGGLIAGLIWRILLSERVYLIDRPYSHYNRSLYGTATQ
eukprot:gene498-626_t